MQIVALIAVTGLRLEGENDEQASKHVGRESMKDSILAFGLLGQAEALRKNFEPPRLAHARPAGTELHLCPS
jgi:hypothetical protein